MRRDESPLPRSRTPDAQRIRSEQPGMTQPLRIAIADDEPEMLEYLHEALDILGHKVVCQAETGAELVERCQTTRVDLIITDIKMPEMDGLEAAATICRDQPIPVILVSAFHDHDLIERALKDQVLAYLVKPIKHADLLTSIALARRRFSEFQALHQQAIDLRQALEDRKFVERAKGILMKRAEIDEPDAFQRLQKLASQENKKMTEIARMIITADEAMEP
ncbi:MAG: response regulator [Planctomycetaceae bacterium]